MTSAKSGCGGPVIAGDQSLKNLLKKIGKGPRLAKDLTRDEAKAALSQILHGQAEPQQVGAFLIAARIKGESAEETAGFLDALREVSERISVSVPKLLELASAHDGKTKTLVLTPFVAAILAKAGVSVLLTGGADVPTKKGVTARHVLQALGARIDGEGAFVKSSLEKNGLAYWDVSRYCPALEALKPLRDSLGLRTALNTVEKVINPAGAAYVATGVFHGPYLKDLSEATLLLGYPSVLCLQATEGSTDLPLKKRALYRWVKAGMLSEQAEIDPEAFGCKRESNAVFLGEGCLLPGAEPDEDDGDLAPDIAKLTEINVKKGLDALRSRQGIVYDALVYNAGVQLWFCDEVASIPEGIRRAADIVAAGGVMDGWKNL